MIAGCACALRQSDSVHDFNLETYVLGFGIVKGNEQAADVEEPAHLRIDSLEQGVRLERRTQCAANFIEQVKFFAAPRGLLNQIAVLHGHSNLMAEREQQPKLRRSKSAIVRRSQQQHAEYTFLRLQANPYHRS